MNIKDTPEFAHNAINLASGGLGAEGLYANDQFFAPLERLLSDKPAIFIEDKYDENGKWMDGWETRRKRGPGHDFAIVKLAVPGRLDGFDVDTAHFVGNYPPACSIEGCLVDAAPDENTQWHSVLPTSPLGPDTNHFFECRSNEVWSHLRLNIYPDGGIARLRVFGQPEIDWENIGADEVDLAASLNGGRILVFSDAHFGDYQRLLAPGRGTNMGDGWETRRRRVPGNDWIIIQLATKGIINRAVVDTAYFKGNYPDSCSIQGADISGIGDQLDDAIKTSSMFWETLLPQQKLTADNIHEFKSEELSKMGPITHVRLNIFPDGGVSRLKLFGKPAIT